MTMQLISTVTVGAGGASSIDFTSIPQTATDLLIVISARSAYGNSSTDLLMTMNGVTGNSYAYRYMRSNGSTIASSALSSTITISLSPVNYFENASYTTNTFSNVSVYVPNYTSTISKTVSIDHVSENNATEAGLNTTAGLFTTSSGITSLSFFDRMGSNLVQYSTASLYTITKGSGGATVTTA